MRIRLLKDQVLIALEPVATETASGIAIVDTGKEKYQRSRFARVLEVGPGHHMTKSTGAGGRADVGAFIPTTVKPGDRVVVDWLAGDEVDYRGEVSAPRHNVSPEFSELLGTRGQFRVVREEEILGFVDEGAAEVA